MESKDFVIDNKTLSLTNIPEKIIVKLLKKIPLMQGVKMRKTCRFMDSLVTSKNIIFTQERDYLFNLELEISTVDGDVSGRIFRRNIYSYGSPNFLTLVKLHKVDSFLGCIFFPCLCVGISKNQLEENAGENAQSINEVVLSFIQRLNLKCKDLMTKGINASMLHHFFSKIVFVKYINSTPQGLYDVLNAISNQSHNVFTYISAMPTEGLLLDRLINFEKVTISGEYIECGDQFARFLKEARWAITGSLKSLRIYIIPHYAHFACTTRVRPTEFWPGCRFIWKGPAFPALNAHDTRIYLMDTLQKTAIISVCFYESRSKSQFRQVLFVRKNDCEEIVLAVFKEFFKTKPIDLSPVLSSLENVMPPQYPSVLRTYLQNIMVFCNFSWIS